MGRHRGRFENIHKDFLDGDLVITRKLQEVPKNTKEPPPPPPTVQDQPMEQDEEDSPEEKVPIRSKKSSNAPFVERVRLFFQIFSDFIILSENFELRMTSNSKSRF